MSKKITVLDSENKLNELAKKLGADFTKSHDFVWAWRECFEWLQPERERKDKLIEELLEVAESYQDEGPVPNGWQSKELKSLIERAKKK